MANIKELTLTEYPNTEYVKNIWKHPHIHIHQRDNIKKYCDAVVGGKIDVKYTVDALFGRFFLNNSRVYSSTVQWNKIRSTLFQDTEFDVDLVNCHNCILLSLSKDYDCPNLQEYCYNRSGVIDSVFICDNAILKYNDDNMDNKTKKDLVKSLFTIILYGGSIDTWKDLFTLTDYDFKLPTFVDDYTEEIKLLSNIIINKKEYKNIKNYVFQKQKDKEVNRVKWLNENKKDKRKKDIEPDFNFNPNKTLSMILQDIEKNIILDAFSFMKNKGVVITSYNYDGFQVLKNGFDIDFIELLNKHIQSLYDENIKFIIKPFNIGLDMTLIPVPLPVIDIKEYSLVDTYEYKKNYMEKFIVKIQNPPMFIVRDVDGVAISTMNFKKISESFNNFKSGRDPFINMWDVDPEQKTYSQLQYKPPPLKTPSYIFNSWAGWRINKITYKKADTHRIHFHIKKMCGLSNTEEVYKWFLNWIAWCIKYPAKKTMVIPILYGKQRIGKSAIAENLFEKIMGKDKLFITGNIDKMFGKHSNLSQKHIVVLNEANGKETKNIHEQIKDAAVRETVIIEPKGIDAYEIDDFINILFTTNTANSADVPEDDSRFMPFHCCEDLFGDMEYFTQLRADMDNDDIMGTFYEEMISKDLSGWNASRDRPMTDLRKDMTELSKCPYKEFLQWTYDRRFEDFENDRCIKYSGNDLYKEFRLFWAEVGRWNNPPSMKSFGVNFKMLPAVTCVKSNGVMKYNINACED